MLKTATIIALAEIIASGMSVLDTLRAAQCQQWAKAYARAQMPAAESTERIGFVLHHLCANLYPSH